MRKIYLFIIGLIAVNVMFAQNMGNTNSNKVRFENIVKDYSKAIVFEQFGFETTNSIATWVSEKGNISLSKKHYKEGEKSLSWQWKKNDFLVVENMESLDKASGTYRGGTPEFYEPAHYPSGKYGGIKMWLYQEIPQTGYMNFQIGSDVSEAKENPKYTFQVNLNFKGWRAVWVNFEEDAFVENYSGSEIMKSFIAFPSNQLKAGTLYLDHITLLDFVSYKRHSDLVFENKKKDARIDTYRILEPYKRYLNTSYNEKADNKNSLKEASDLISKRLEFLIIGNGTNNWKKRASGIEKSMDGMIANSKKVYAQLNIKRSNDYVNGKPLFSSRDEHGVKEGFFFQTIGQATLFPLAIDYKVNKVEKSKEKLFNLFDYFQDQGWAAGSALGTVDHVIRLNSMAQSIFMVRNELAAEGKLDDKVDMLAWHSRIGGILDLDYTRQENTDRIRGAALVKLVSGLLLENNNKKAGILMAFKEYMDYVIGFAPGYGDTIKPDYSLFHHEGTYLNVYGPNSLNTMALVHWLLEDTPYALSAKSTDILKKTLNRQADIAFGIDLHYGVSGRFPYDNSAIGRFLLPAYAFMSLRGNDISDDEMARRFNYYYGITNPKKIISILAPALTYSGTFGTLDLMVQLHEKLKDKTLAPSDTHISMPYSSMSVHRIGDAYATVKGYNKYVWDFETGSSKGENNLGRYLSHGTMIVAQNNPEKGFEGAGLYLNDGFHWGYLPGATTKALPINLMNYINVANEKYFEGYHRSYAETTFSGGLTQENKNGMYAMFLRDDVGPDKDKILFDNSFRAKKSYFFIGNEIICLGSNIENSDERYNTITTLFQYKYNPTKNTLLNGTSIGNSLDLNTTIDKGFFTDANGIHYLLGENTNVVLEQNQQESLKKVRKKYEPIITPHVKAYVTHGAAPKNGSYEYQLLTNTSSKKALELYENKSYNVTAKNKKVHSIYHKASGITAYAIFETDADLNNGPLFATDTPIMAMFKKPGKYSVLTIANPDLKLHKWNHNMSLMPDDIKNGNASGGLVTVTLNGEWYLARDVYEVASLTVQNNKTTISIYCKDGKSIDIPLQNRINKS